MYEVVYFKFWARCNFIATVEEVEGRNIIRFVVEYFQNEVVSDIITNSTFNAFYPRLLFLKRLNPLSIHLFH